MSSPNQTALIVIDLQNDYFPAGAFPLWEAEACLTRCLDAIVKAQAAGMPIFLVQHLADAAKGIAPFFNPGTMGAQLHPRLLAAAPEASVIVKHFADSFLATSLSEALQAQGVERLILCGMMTQNCVTHTALSRQAERYTVQILGDCCTSVSQMIHLIALNALAPRVAISSLADALTQAG